MQRNNSSRNPFKALTISHCDLLKPAVHQGKFTLSSRAQLTSLSDVDESCRLGLLVGGLDAKISPPLADGPTNHSIA